MQYIGPNNEKLLVEELNSHDASIVGASGSSDLTLLWAKSDNNELVIDNVHYPMKENELICLTEFHHVDRIEIESIYMIRFNRDFYCILDHDSEVSCKGLLFYGASSVPMFNVEGEDLEVLKTVWRMLQIEMKSVDHLQLNMLQMMVTRILILCTRMFRKQQKIDRDDKQKVDILREYNFLVEQHFRDKHTVADYAQLMFKSPKTLSNIFKKLGDTTPLQYIKNRRMLEARRLLAYTDKNITEIGYELGFSDVQSFSRFFKKEEGLSPADFKKNVFKGKIDN